MYYLGGEKVRLSFAKLLLKHDNLLILDEPTNHLDIPGREALEEALNDFDGTILFVSHDRYFVSHLANKLIQFENGQATFLEKTWDEYEQDLVTKASMVMESEISKKEEVVKVEKKPKLSPDSLRREIKKIEEKITKKEEELEAMRALRFEPEYYQDYKKMNLLDQDIDDIHNELAHLYEEWEELSEQA